MTDASPRTGTRNKMPLHWKMAIGFIAGLLLGVLVYSSGLAEWGIYAADNPLCSSIAGAPWQCTPWVSLFIEYVTDPVGQLFLRLIFMLVIPLLFSALVVGVSEMGDVQAFGRIGWRTLGLTVLMSTIAVVIGLVLVNWLQPGAGIDPLVAQQLLAENAQRTQGIVNASSSSDSGLGMLLSIVPDNIVGAAADGTILAVMFFALMLGLGMVLTPGNSTDTLRRALGHDVVTGIEKELRQMETAGQPSKVLLVLSGTNRAGLW